MTLKGRLAATAVVASIWVAMVAGGFSYLVFMMHQPTIPVSTANRQPLCHRGVIVKAGQADNSEARETVAARLTLVIADDNHAATS
jgi:hypothetical protein